VGDLVSDLRKEIIESGYKAMMKAHHPDSFPASERTTQDEICKRLAVSRDWLLGLLDRVWAPESRNPNPASRQWVPPYMPTPAIVQPIDVGELLVDAMHRFIDSLANPRKRATRKRRPNRSDRRTR
jgi:hypothetical protein